MADINDLLSYDHAMELTLSLARTEREGPHPLESVALGECAGRVLAKPILADRDLPPFDRSTKDGFAARATELMSGVVLQVAETVQAGQQLAGEVASGECWQIMTGAAVPAGADCVVMIEHVNYVQKVSSAQNAIQLAKGRKIKSGENIVGRGAEAEADVALVGEGTRLRAQQIALAASSGYARLQVYGKPRVAIVSTGSELVAVEAQPGAVQIRDSNSWALAEMVRSLGGEAHRLSIVGDTLEELQQVFQSSRQFDALVLTGGVSAGLFDLVEEALDGEGAELLFTGVKIQPGKPVVLARRPNGEGKWQWIFALPGNPVSAMVTFQLFARPMILALCGEHAAGPTFAWAPFVGEHRGKSGLRRFLPSKLGSRGVELVRWQGSGDIRAFASANCCVVLDEEQAEVRDGELVRIWSWH
jgi:molybdopterin molybdotransferase